MPIKIPTFISEAAGPPDVPVEEDEDEDEGIEMLAGMLLYNITEVAPRRPIYTSSFRFIHKSTRNTSPT